MASARSFLVNANPQQDIRMLDSFIDEHIFEHPMFNNIELLKKNSEEIIMDARYNFRPDLLSYEVYGTNFWYPAILIANNLGSIFQFKDEYLNNKCLVPSPAILMSIMDKAEADKIKRMNKNETN